MKTPNFYDFLNIPLFSSAKKIETAYLSKVEILEKDAENPSAARALELLVEWHQKVSSPRTKRGYDHWLYHKEYGKAKRR